MKNYQPCILQPLPEQAIYLTCNLNRSASLQQVIEILQSLDTNNNVVAIGQSLLDRFKLSVPGMKTMPTFASKHIGAATATDLWCWMRGDDRGELLHRTRRIIRHLAPVFDVADTIDAYLYAGGRDLTGYEDGTENPVAGAAIEAAILISDNVDIDGSSFVAVQQWQHDLDTFATLPDKQQDNLIGRRRSDNLELDDAPQSAHVKRTAQENFNPEAFLVRRSMPWSIELQAGLMFVAFGRSFDAFEAQLNRMTGADDGIEDGLFQFSRVLNSAYYWCPPVIQGQINLAAINQ
jgi:putative iron-dependent peroxidase